MSTSGAIAGQAFNFNYSFVSSADPTLFHTTVLATTDITIYQRTGGSTVSAGNPVTAPTVSGNVHTISLTAGEMSGDEVVLDISSTGMVSEVISISLETAQADVIKIDSNTAAASRLALSAGQIVPGTVDTVTNAHTPTVVEFQADDITEPTGDHYNGRIIIFTSGALLSQATEIIDYALVGGIGQFTVVSMTDAPANNDTFIIV